MATEHLVIGMRVRVVREGKTIDEATVERIETDRCPPYGQVEVEVKSLILRPGRNQGFGFAQGGWRVLFEDPFTHQTCFSQRAPTYTFASV